MRHILLILVVVLASSVYASTEVFDSYVNATQAFTLNNIEYTFDYSWDSSKALIQSTYSKIIVSQRDCRKLGYLEFCLGNSTNETEREDTQFRLIINQEGCIAYQADNGTACRYKVGETCSTDYSCESDKCLHGICTFRYPICGDGYCDEKEKCKEDCEIKINDSSVNDTITNKTVEEVIEEPPAAKPEQPKVEFVEEPKEEASTFKKAIIWISINAILISVGWMVGFSIYKKRKGL